MGGAVLVHPRPDEVFAELAREWKPAWRRFVAERDAFCGADAERSRAILSFVIRAHLAGLVDHETGLLLQALQELGEGYALLSAPENGLSEELALRVSTSYWRQSRRPDTRTQASLWDTRDPMPLLRSAGQQTLCPR